LQCGGCPAGQQCGAGNKCSDKPCEKKGCAAVGAWCGTASDGCGGTQECGKCGAGKACQAGKCVCVPTTCKALAVTCGLHDNGCGGKLDCGACPICTPTCPTGFQCGDGKCSGGDLKGLVLDIKTLPVSGTVTLNGQTPKFGQYCTSKSSSKYLRVRFKELTRGYTIEVIRPCSSQPHDFSFQTNLFPGTYEVRASGYHSGYSNLPTTTQVIYDKLVVQQPKSGLVLDIKTRTLIGKVTLNGGTPQFGQYCTSKSSSKYLRVRFVEVGRGYTIEVFRPCSSQPHDFSFKAVVFPGVYKVSASGYHSGYSNLPNTLQVIIDKLVVP